MHMLVPDCDHVLSHLPTDPFRSQRYIAYRCPQEYRNEVISPKANQDITFTQRIPSDIGYLANHPVADGMPVGVVDAFEMVKI